MKLSKLIKNKNIHMHVCFAGAMCLLKVLPDLANSHRNIIDQF